jgi:hypothetical protein
MIPRKTGLAALAAVMAAGLAFGAPRSGAAAVDQTGAQAPAKARVKFELGGHIDTFDHLARMRDIGMTWAKIQVNPDWEPDLTAKIKAAHAAGLKLLVGAVGDRTRASDPAYHRQLASQVAAWARQGVDAIEIWNEPNLDREYGYGKVDPANYLSMLRQAYTAIKKARRATLVVGAASAPTGAFGGGCTANGCDDSYFLAQLAKLGAARYMDCIGAHHNAGMVGPDQTKDAPVGNADHYSWYFWGTLNVTYNAFRGRVPVCWTEFGYVTGEGIGPLPGGFTWGNAITLDQQAEWLARAAQLSRDSGKVKIMIVWNIDFRKWDEDPQAGYSIIRPNGECRACDTIRAVMVR